MNAIEDSKDVASMKMLSDAIHVWRGAALAALIATALVVFQDALFGGLPTDTPIAIAFAQYSLPWLMWAALAPALLFAFAKFPIDLHNPRRALGGYVLASIVVVGLKLVLSVPLTALLVWRPLDVPTADGMRWLLANRGSANLVIFWLLLATYTCYRYYRLGAGADAFANQPADVLARIPIRNGERTAFVPLQDVSFIEAERNQVVIHTRSGQHGIRTTLQELEVRLPPRSFLRIHRSRMVNLDSVEAVEPWGRGDYVLILRDGTRLLSGKTYRDAIRRILHVSST
jgi:hypothetical protein